MKQPGIMVTLAGLFALAALWQGATILASPDTWGWSFAEEGEASQFASRDPDATDDGIKIIHQDAEPVKDPDAALLQAHTALRAEKHELEKQAQQIAKERALLDKEKSALVSARADERQRIADLYARMPSEKAAAILAALEPAEAALFIELMSGDAGADILAAMSSTKAVAITKELLKERSAA